MQKALKSDRYLVGILILFFVLVYAFIGVQKHNHFQTFAWDTAIFDQQLYLVSQLKVPFSSLHGFIGLGDHFHPLFYLAGGVSYKIWSDARMLYILQSLIACLSAWPLYLLNKKLLRKINIWNFLRSALNFTICFVYLFSVSFQFVVTGEYNDASNVALPLIFCLYFLLTKNNLGYWVSFFIVLLVKEEYALIALPMGIYIYLLYKDYKKSLLTIFIGLLTFFFLTFQLMPMISGTKEYIFFTDKNRPSNVFINMINNPSLFVTKFFDNEEKRKTILVSLTSFSFLPLLSPVNLIMPVSNLAIRFYDGTVPRRYEFNNQYAAGLVPLMAVATSFGIYNFLSFLQKRRRRVDGAVMILILYLLFFSFLQDLIFHGPINALLKRQFYEVQSWEVDSHELIARVPKGVVVASQNSLLPHLSQRERFLLLPNVGDAEYVAVDLENGPNKFAPLQDASQMSKLVDKLIEEKKFEIVWQKNKALLLKKV